MLLQLLAFGQKDGPVQDWPNLKKYASENTLLPAPVAGEKRVVFMGNSITEGWKNVDSNFFANPDYINRGISGQTSSQMLLRFRQDVIDLKPALVVILAGTNDIAENTGPISLENILGNIISMAELARVNKIHVVLSSVLPAYEFGWHPGLQPAEKIIRLNSMIKEYAYNNKLTYVNYHAAMADERNGLDKKYSGDGVHPTIEGYRVMEPLVEQAIKAALKRKIK